MLLFSFFPPKFRILHYLGNGEEGGEGEDDGDEKATATLNTQMSSKPRSK